MYGVLVFVGMKNGRYVRLSKVGKCVFSSTEMGEDISDSKISHT